MSYCYGYYGYYFLLYIISDCIGSAFNAKGAMQCPNCRKIEKGQWLYANGSRSYPEFNMEDWTRDEDVYDLSYSEMVIETEGVVILVRVVLFIALHYKHDFALFFYDNLHVINTECLFCLFICYFRVYEVICCLHNVCYCFRSYLLHGIFPSYTFIK